jgi:Zn-dependent protease with chaperone function
MRHFVAMLFAVGLAASPQIGRADTHFYLVQSIAEKSSEPADRAQADELEKIFNEMERQSGVNAILVYSTNPDINAFATEVGPDKIVVVQEGLLRTMDDDRDAVAAVLGHELGHHKADHIRAGRHKQESARVLGAILGAVVGAKVGRSSGDLAGAAAGAAVGVAGNLVALKFSRDQEMEADRLSVGWMIAAGYNPQGMLRLQQRLGELEGHSHAAIFSTHPTSAKRYQAAAQLIAKLAPPADLLAHAVEPLVGSDALLAATAQVKNAQDAQLREILKPQGDEISVAALAPVDKIGFDTYAALENQLLFAGDKGKPPLLAKNHLTAAQLKHMTEDFTARMQESPALTQRYNAEFFRATQGKLAPYGRDLAESYAQGQPLKLDPPYPLEVARSLLAQMLQHGAPDMDAVQKSVVESGILKAQGLTYYDFLIGHNWWSRKAKIAALTGDDSIMREYYGLDSKDADDDHANAEAAGVHIGNNVHIGANVRIGSGAAKAQKPADPQDGG